MNNTEIKEAIKDLKDGLNSKFTPEQFKPRMEAKIKELESQLSAEKPAPLKERYSSSDTNPNVPKAKVTSAQRQNAKYDKIWASKLENDKKREEESKTPILKKSVPVSKASTKYAEDEDGYC